MSWKRLAILLALVCSYQLYRDCTRRAPRSHAADCPRSEVTSHTVTPDRAGFGDDEAHPQAEGETPAVKTPGFHIAGFGVSVPPWAMFFVPRAGEDLRAYRDRLLPIAERAIAPQRTRVAHARDELAQLIHMDARQRAELDGATTETATALENRVMSGIANGDFELATFKPMTGVGLAMDLLDTVEKGNQRWQSSLSQDQKAKLSGHPFDFADYLVFSTPWEDLLKLL